MKFGKSFLIVISCCFVLTISFLVGDLFMFASSCPETTPKNAKCTGGLIDSSISYTCAGGGPGPDGQSATPCASRISNPIFQQQKIEEKDNTPEQTKTKTDTDPINMVTCVTYTTCKLNFWHTQCLEDSSGNEYKINPLKEVPCL
jgi:hypothetical protein